MGVFDPQISEEDIKPVLLRPLTDIETESLEYLSGQARAIIETKIDFSKIDPDTPQGARYLSLVKHVMAQAVARVFRNPDGFLSESDGQYSYQLSLQSAGGYLTVLPREWELLGVGANGAWGMARPANDGYVGARGSLPAAERFQPNYDPTGPTPSSVAPVWRLGGLA